MTAEPVNREAQALEPCPFCKGSDIEITDATRALGVWSLLHRCKIVGALEISNGDRDVVVARWSSRPQPVAETVEAREFIENWFAPWGSWKTAWWEMAVSDDVEMTDANALKALRKILAALRPSAHGEAG